MQYLITDKFMNYEEYETMKKKFGEYSDYFQYIFVKALHI